MKNVRKAVVATATVAALTLANAGAALLPVAYVGQDPDIVAQINDCVEIQDKAHEMAELARELGLEETHDAIQSAKSIWTEQQDQIDCLQQELDDPRDVSVSMAPHVPSGLTAAAFNKMLESTAMAGQGTAFVKMEQETGTNGIFAIGVAGSESGIGSACYGYNPYGMLSGGRLICYNSWADATMAFGRLIASGTYARASTVRAINSIYCPGDGGYWTQKVTTFMNQCMGKIAYA